MEGTRAASAIAITLQPIVDLVEDGFFTTQDGAAHRTRRPLRRGSGLQEDTTDQLRSGSSTLGGREFELTTTAVRYIMPREDRYALMSKPCQCRLALVAL